MASPALLSPGMSQPAARNEPHTTGSDWEYEYDDAETEDIYFTLDLTTHVPNAIQEKQYAKNGKLIGTAGLEKNIPVPEYAPEGDDNALNLTEDPPDDDTANNAAPAEAGKLQILGLHTKKPYVKYNNGFYTCHWFTDLGTQFWITNPGVVDEPKLSGHVLDVVGSSQTRLVARPANLKRKRETSETARPTPGDNATESIEITEDAASDALSDAESRPQEQDPTQPMVIPRQKIKDPHLEAQASFMERLSALKIKKGEKDAHRIPLRIPVYYKGAHNADALRAAHSVNVDENSHDIQPAAAAIPTAGDRISPTQDNNNDNDNGAVEGAQAQAHADTDSPAPAPVPRSVGKRPRGGYHGGGAASHASRRSNLGLELAGEPASSAPKKKRGRPSNAEKLLRAQQAATAAAAEQEQEQEQEQKQEQAGNNNAAASSSFALDPLLGGSTQTAGAAAAVNDNDKDTDNADDNTAALRASASQSREGSAAPGPAASSAQDQSQSQSQNPNHQNQPPISEQQRPRKRRRTKAQMEEARRLDEARQSNKNKSLTARAASSVNAVIAGQPALDLPVVVAMAGAGQRSARRSTRSRNSVEATTGRVVVVEVEGDGTGGDVVGEGLRGGMEESEAEGAGVGAKAAERGGEDGDGGEVEREVVIDPAL